MRRHARRLIAVVAAVTLVSSATAVAQDVGDLSAVEQRLDEIADEIAQAEAKADAADQRLAQADERLDEVEGIVNDLARQLQQQEAEVAAAQKELDRLAARAEEVEAAFTRRTIDMFKHSSGTELDVVFSSGDIQEALDRQSMLQQLNESDRATVEQVRAARGAVLTQQEVLDREVERLEQMKAEQERVLEQVRQIRESRALAAARAKDRVDELEHRHEDLESEQARIEELIAARQSPPSSIAPPSTSSGSSTPSSSGFAWPNCGTVTSEYGYRWGRRHTGIDIDDNRTSSIRASRSGSVIYAEYQGGYGNMTIIDHGDGTTTAYAHQAAIAVSQGQSVSQGQHIGTIGSTGNSTGPHLHFEIRVNGSAQNPRNYLSGGC